MCGGTLSHGRKMDDSDHDPQHLLDLLNAHGQQFLASFDSDALAAKTRPAKRKAACVSDEEDTLNVDPGAEEEWEGIGHTDANFDEQGVPHNSSLQASMS
jgi:hypothetical protein